MSEVSPINRRSSCGHVVETPLLSARVRYIQGRMGSWRMGRGGREEREKKSEKCVYMGGGMEEEEIRDDGRGREKKTVKRREKIGGR